MENDPLDKVFRKPTQEELELEIDRRLTFYLARMPDDLKQRFKELVEQRVREMVEAELARRRAAEQGKS